MSIAHAIGAAMFLTLNGGAASAHGTQERVIVTEQTAGVVKARAGEAVQIRLRSQPGTGFSWVPTSRAGSLTPLPSIKGQAIPGGWQTQRFRFLARRPGTYRLTFSYDQPWKGGTKGARAAAFTIKVR